MWGPEIQILQWRTGPYLQMHCDAVTFQWEYTQEFPGALVKHVNLWPHSLTQSFSTSEPSPMSVLARQVWWSTLRNVALMEQADNYQIVWQAEFESMQCEMGSQRMGHGWGQIHRGRIGMWLPVKAERSIRKGQQWASQRVFKSRKKWKPDLEKAVGCGSGVTVCVAKTIWGHITKTHDSGLHPLGLGKLFQRDIKGYEDASIRLQELGISKVFSL